MFEDEPFYVLKTCKKDNEIFLNRKIYLSDEGTKWLRSLQLNPQNFDIDWKNENVIVEIVDSFTISEIEHFLWPKIGQHIEILKDDTVDIVNPELHLQAYRIGPKFEINKEIETQIKTIYSLGYHIFDTYYYLVDGKVCFDGNNVLQEKKLCISQILPYTFLTAFKKYHRDLKTINKHVVPEFNCRSKLEPVYADFAKFKLYEIMLSENSIKKLSRYGELNYHYQSGDSQIWISKDKKYVIKLNPYLLLFNHEVSMLKELERYQIVPTIYEYWSLPCENIMVMSFNGITLNEKYKMIEIAPDDIQSQIKNITNKLKELGLEHLDAHYRNWLVDDNDKVWLIDLEHLIYQDRSKIKDKEYLKHIKSYFENN